MKKALSFLLIFVVLFSFAGCSGDDSGKKKSEKAEKIELETGQMFIEFKKKSVIVTYMMRDDDAEYEYDINMKDSKKDIEEDLEDYFSDLFNDNVKISELKKGKDYISFSVEVDADSFIDFYEGSYHEKYTLKEHVYLCGYASVEDFGRSYRFVSYKNDKKVDSGDLGKYKNDYLVWVSSIMDNGSRKGIYYKLPSKILLVSKELKYEKISDDTIFIKRNSDGIIVVKN